MRVPVLQQIAAGAQTAARFGVFDPCLNTARTAGVVRWGPTLSAMVHAAALRWPGRAAVVDDAGTLSYRKLDRCADRLARTLRASGSGPVGLLCRNHRGFVLGHLSLERAGRTIVLLSTGLPETQLIQVIEREQLEGVIADEEFASMLGDLNATVWPGDPKAIASWGRAGSHRWPSRRSDVVLLTSGTTGPPKGARQRRRRPSLSDAALLDALPVRVGATTLVLSPLFHAWGFAQASLTLATGSTLVLQDRFDPATALDVMRRHDVTTLAAVPLMLSRMLDVAGAEFVLPKLRTVLSSGNVLSASLARAWAERFGHNLYNIYGSTETAIATVATPRDLAEAPGTVGRPPHGVHIAILDSDGEPVSTGAMGRVFTANAMQFDGYTNGTTRARIGSLMATGDMGYLDAQGRLFVDGRENDLMVTGGENVFPSQVEELLDTHPHIEQSAVVGLPDDEFGQIIASCLVVRPEFSSADFDSWCRQELAGFQRPRRIHVVDALPMTTTGKVKRNDVVRLFGDQPTKHQAGTKKAR